MSVGPGKRRAAAELRWSDGENPVARVGSRTLHHHWALLAPHFRPVWLAPQRRADERGVAWTWIEVGDGPPPTAAELAEIRRRMTDALAAWREDPAAEAAGAALAKVVEQVVTGMVKKTDGRLAAFVCRTEAGLRVHSWGATTAATPFFPDALDRGVSGRLLVGDKDAAGLEVVLENPKGLVVARTQTDSAGAFEFTQVSAGSYRVRVLADRVDFPVNGLEVEVGRTSVTGLELRSTALNIAAEKQAAERASGARGGALAAAEPDEDSPVAAQGGRSRRRRFPGAWLARSAAAAALGWWYFSPDTAKGGGQWVAEAEVSPSARRLAVASDPGQAASTEPARTPRESVNSAAPGNLRATGADGSVSAARETAGPADAERTPQPRDPRLKPAPEVEEQETVHVAWAPVGAGGAAPTHAAGGGSARPAAGAAHTSPSATLLDGNRATRGATAVAVGAEATGSAVSTEDEVSRARRSGQVGPRPRGTSGAPAETAHAGAPSDPPRASEDEAATSPRRASETEGGERIRVLREMAVAAPPREEAVGSRKSASTRDGRAAAGDDADTRPPASAPARVPARRAVRPVEPAEANGDSAPPEQRLATDENEATPKEVQALAGPARIATSDSGLAWAGQVRVSEWQMPRIGDEIVPTQPVLAGEDDALEVWRERLRRERRGRLPITLAEPTSWQGVTVTVPPEMAGGLRWRVPAASAGVEARVIGATAEIGWRAGGRAQAVEFGLETAAGRVMARVRLTAQGIAEVETVPGGRVGGWIGVECAAGDRRGLAAGERSRRFDWRQGNRGALPAEWKVEADWRGGQGRRLEFPVGAGFPAREVELYDSMTGWAMSCAIEVR